MSLKKKEKEKVRPESCYIYKSTLAQQDESTFILNLAVISVNEERGSEYLRNEICVCNSALESVVLICTSKSHRLKSSVKRSREPWLSPAAARAAQPTKAGALW